MSRTILTIGIIILLMGVNIISSFARDVEIVNDVEHPLHLTVAITYPENGIYCNDQKILPFCVPLVLYGNISLEVEIKPLSEVDKVEFYIDGGFLFEITDPPFEFGNDITPFIKPFSRTTIKIIAYSIDGSHDSDEITIWRIFS